MWHVGFVCAMIGIVLSLAGLLLNAAWLTYSSLPFVIIGVIGLIVGPDA